jgi:hypothetical protein
MQIFQCPKSTHCYFEIHFIGWNNSPKERFSLNFMSTTIGACIGYLFASMGNHKMTILIQDYELYIVYHYATMTGPLLDLWIMALEARCVNVGFLVPTTMHLIYIFPPGGFTRNFCALTCQYTNNVWWHFQLVGESTNLISSLPSYISYFWAVPSNSHGMPL